MSIEITTVEYSRTRQVQQYEPETLKVTANIGDMDVQDAIREVKFQVHKAMGLTKARKLPVKPNEKVKFEDVEEIVEGGDIKMKDGEVKDAETTDIVPEEEKPKKKAKKKAKKSVKKEVKEEKAPEKTFTLEEVQVSMKELAKVRGVSIAKDILKDFGVVKTKELEVKDYSAVMVEVTKCLK